MRRQKEFVYNPFILTFSPNECQSKSFEKMNTLLSAIFKFCTTKKNLLQIVALFNSSGIMWVNLFSFDKAVLNILWQFIITNFLHEFTSKLKFVDDFNLP